jgi:hypothetical protein
MERSVIERESVCVCSFLLKVLKRFGKQLVQELLQLLEQLQLHNLREG